MSTPHTTDTTNTHNHPIHTDTRTPITKNNGNTLYINIPAPITHAIDLNPTDKVTTTLHNNNAPTMWYKPRSIQNYGTGNSLYVNIPEPVVDLLNITENTTLNITAYPDRIEYDTDNHPFTLVIKK